MPEILDFPLLADETPESGEALALLFDDRFNALYDAVNDGTGALFQRDTENSIGLLHADFGGHVITNDGGRVAVMAATYALPDSEAAVYVEIDAAGTRSHRLDNFTTDGTRKPLAIYATDAASITSFADARVDFDFMAGGGGASATVVDQTAHGFAVENVLAFDGTDWFKAQADALANCAGTLGIVAEVVSANRFKIQTVAGSRLDFLTGKTPGAKYYLSTVAAGVLTAIVPTAVGECIVEVLTAESATTGFLSPLLVVEIAAVVSYATESELIAHESDTGNPHSVTQAQVGLSNVDNTSDATKNAAAVTLTNKTLTTPTVASFTNAQHSHLNAAGGGLITSSAISDFTAAVQALLNTLDVKTGYQYATAAALPANTYSNGSSGVGATLTGTANGPLSVDSILLPVGAKMLVKNEADATHNGWYVLTQQGVALVSPYILTRATDADQAAEMGPGYLTPIEGPTGSLGTLNNGTLWLSLGPSPFVVGTSSITFAQEDASGALLKANNLSDLASASSARTNLGLAALALLATVGTAQIDNDAVTYAKIQNVSATDKLLGRSTAGAGDVEEIACTAAARALLDDASATVQRATMGAMSSERRILTMTGATTASSDDLKVRLLVLRGSPAADSVLTLPNEEFFVFVTNETGVDITVTRDTSGVTDTLPPEPDTTATRLYKWIP